jgi:hypothetical protein
VGKIFELRYPFDNISVGLKKLLETSHDVSKYQYWNRVGIPACLGTDAGGIAEMRGLNATNAYAASCSFMAKTAVDFTPGNAIDTG